MPLPASLFRFRRTRSVETLTDFGSLTVLFGLIHGFAHMARLFTEGHERKLIEKPMDRSGLVALFLLLPIALPMMFASLRSSVSEPWQGVCMRSSVVHRCLEGNGMKRRSC